MEEYSGLIFTICYSMTRDHFEAEDLAQETFISAYRNLDNFDGAHAKAWLATIAANKCRDHLKNAARRTTPADAGTFENLPTKEAQPEETVLKVDAERRMRVLCQRLKEPYKSAAEKYFCENKSTAEIATEIGKNLKTVQTQLYRARTMLRDLWKEEYQ